MSYCRFFSFEALKLLFACLSEATDAQVSSTKNKKATIVPFRGCCGSRHNRSSLSVHRLSMRRMAEMIGKLRQDFFRIVFNGLRRKSLDSQLDSHWNVRVAGPSTADPTFIQDGELIRCPTARMRESLSGRRTGPPQLN